MVQQALLSKLFNGAAGTKWAGRVRLRIDLATMGNARNFRSPCSAFDLQLIAQQRLYISTASQDTQNQFIFIMKDVSCPPAHRDKTAMNGAQLSKSHGDSSGLMSVPPASGPNISITRRVSDPGF
jgi:hypothetical protein